ncbi:MAG TPA: TonB-dependent receptor [Candidatus Marinimicrobia bacterium]|nr:TonB-dependent receptor [Candidatus Neomarinimicrobiota bacterium]HIB95921.1 TonB-dependent receptor [Candidatus Neomarinimicrobiota bacterium]HIO75531.1 TonB-dependent receptor [Candidatus Neomarinimicrobiota bacterium]
MLSSVLLFLLLTLPVSLFAQATVSGRVTDAETGQGLAGANVVIEGTSIGAAANATGDYSISDVPAGTQTVTASVIGYASSSTTVNVPSSGSVTTNFALSGEAIELSGLEVLASRADERTPVAYTNVTKADMEFRLGSQDIPMSLNTTPSVYATQQGGGAGDARINVRGFNQRNVAVMINGVPQNDMENGWVYWSNWDGVGDVASIQMQRGLSAVNLATPSIGGSMNIITDPTALSSGGKFRQEIGAGGFVKTTLNYNTGLIGDKMAFSGTIVRKTGDGVIDKTWTDAWAYYFGASYAMNETNRFELYAVGAPQRHGQNLYKQNLGAYDSDFAASVDGYDTGALGSDGQFRDEGEANGIGFGRTFNQNWAPVSSSYQGKQYWYMYGAKTVDRHSPDFLNERENFFHKPLVNLNHYLTLNSKMRLSSILYWSGGSGGGTGTYGKIPTMDADENLGDDDYKFYYGRSPWVRDWDALITMNSGSDATVYVDKTALSRDPGQSVGILRNSINRQNTYGLISKLNLDMSDALKLQLGVDWRMAGIEHAREVRDLMGGDYYIDFADDNYSSGKQVKLGDIIAYHNETTVDWIGFFAQGNYTAGPISAYGMAGFSSIAYSYQDHFTVADEKIVADPISTMQFKGGAMFDLNESMSVFANFGLSEKPPIMDNVIYFDGTVASDPANEKFQSMEAGANYSSGMFAVKTSYYNTDWQDRNLTKAVTSGQGSSGDTDVIFLSGINQNHSGIEVEASAQLMSMLRFDAAVSLGNWKFVGDASGNYQEDEFNEQGQVIGQTSTTYNYALDGLFVGDMPQTGYVMGITLTPISGLRAQVLYNMYDKNYSDWGPSDREYSGNDSDADRAQVWQAPGYSKMDVHVTYDLPSMGGLNLQVFAHVFNALDDVYVQDAVDHSQYNSYGDKVHAAHNAEVFLGIPRYFNAGLTVRF